MRRILIAIVAIALTTLIAVVLTRGWGGAATNNASTNTTPRENADGTKYERGPLLDLPTLDPVGLWPADGARVASEKFWSTWQTDEHVHSRMLLSDDGLLWRAFGDSTAKNHDRQVDLGLFGSRVKFCVEFEEKGKTFRSRVRTAVFGRGAHFKDREVHVLVKRATDQRQEIELVGGNPKEMTEDFELKLVPNEAKVGYVPLAGDDSGGKILLVVDGTTIPEAGLVCFLEVKDRRTETVDRIKLIIDLN